MPKFIVEREIPGASKLTAEERQAGAQKSNEVLDELGVQIQWIHTYLTTDKMFCVYLAPNAEIIQRHADVSGFPADRICQVHGLLDPNSAN